VCFRIIFFRAFAFLKNGSVVTSVSKSKVLKFFETDDFLVSSYSFPPENKEFMPPFKLPI
jgi:hypothetical protein